MADIAGEQLACQYCETDIRVPAEWSRYEASVAHFEAEHVGRQRSWAGTDEHGEAVARSTSGEREGEEAGVSN